MKFSYRVLTPDGTLESGVVDVESRRHAMRQLGQGGRYVVSVDVLRAGRVKNIGRVNSEVVLQFFEELVTLLESGVTLIDAIDSLAESRGDHDDGLLSSLRIAFSSLQQGKSFSDSLIDSGLKVPDYMAQLILAGELNGKLARTLFEGVEQMRFDQAIATDTRNALIYPLVLVVTGILAVGLVFALVVPKFSNLLNGEVELPFLARFVLEAGVFFNSYAIEVLVGLLVSVLSIIRFFQLPSVRSVSMNRLSTFPVVGQWLVESESGRWASVLGALVANGVPLMVSLELANKGVRIPIRRRKYQLATQEVKSGEKLSDALKDQGVLLPAAYNMLRVGERSGDVAKILKSLASYYEKKSRTRLKRMLILIEPISILFIGGSIGVIILGIILAITSASDIPL